MKDPEDICEECGRENPVWFAPSEIWNKAVREQCEDADLMLCPMCFIKRAEAVGFNTRAWRVAPEEL